MQPLLHTFKHTPTASVYRRHESRWYGRCSLSFAHTNTHQTASVYRRISGYSLLGFVSRPRLCCCRDNVVLNLFVVRRLCAMQSTDGKGSRSAQPHINTGRDNSAQRGSYPPTSSVAALRAGLRPPPPSSALSTRHRDLSSTHEGSNSAPPWCASATLKQQTKHHHHLQPYRSKPWLQQTRQVRTCDSFRKLRHTRTATYRALPHLA
jgi:hypothetical protein